MMTINDFFITLADTPGRNDKIAFLEAHKNNSLLRDVVRLALDPFTQFYIRKIPEYKTSEPIFTLSTAIDMLYELSSRTVTGNSAIDHLKNILSSISEDDAKVIERIIKKDLKCGVSVSTANKIWMGLVKEYPTMLCSQYNEKLVDQMQFPALVQTKMDGMRFNAIVREGKVEFRSRNGKEINLLKRLEPEFLEMAGTMDCVFDGELLVSHGNELLDRQTGNGILNKAVKGTISEEEADKVRATVWDCIPYLYFVDHLCPVEYETRFERVTKAIDTINQTKIKAVQSWVVNDINEANILFQELLSKGEEGIILKSKEGVWENKRAKHQIKFKGELECDLKIVDVLSGTGKYEGMLGSVVCESDDGVIQVNVGSGFNENQRETLKKEDLIGKIVAVKYNTRITNKQGEESLFLPIFIELREDKDVADNSKDIK